MDWDVAPEVSGPTIARLARLLGERQTEEELRAYFDPLHNYAGSTFNLLSDGGETSQIEAADLLAVSLLKVPFPARATRLLLDDEAVKEQMNSASPPFLSERRSGRRRMAPSIRRTTFGTNCMGSEAGGLAWARRGSTS